MEGYPLNEFITDMIQAAVLVCLIVMAARLALLDRSVLVYKLIAGAFGCYFMALVFWIPHYYIMQDWPQGIIAASDLGFIGSYCFFLSAHFALAEKQSNEQKRAEQRYRFAALAAPVVTVLFFVSYILLEGSIIANILYAAPVAVWSYFSLRSFLAGKKSPARLYYGLVLIAILLELLVFEVSFFDDNTLYVILTYPQMASWLLIPSALRKAVEA